MLLNVSKKVYESVGPSSPATSESQLFLLSNILVFILARSSVSFPERGAPRTSRINHMMISEGIPLLIGSYVPFYINFQLRSLLRYYG